MRLPEKMISLSILRKFKEYWPFLILFLLWATVAIFNVKIYWALIDDGWEVTFAKNLFDKLLTLNLSGFASTLSEGDGRLRIVFWIYRIFLWIIGGHNSQIYHLANMLVIGATVLFIYLVVEKITKSKIISTFGAIFYLIIPTNTENIIRIGTAEPLLVLLISIVLYLMVENRKVLLPCIFLLLAIFGKETSVFALFPVLFVYYILSKKYKFVKNKKLSFVLWLCVAVSAILVVVISLLQRRGYSTNYVFDLPMFAGNLLIYIKDLTKNTLFVLPILFATFYSKLIYDIFKNKKFNLSMTDFFELIFSLGFICFLIVQLPWKYAVSRYLMPEVYFAIVFMAIEISRIYQHFNKTNLFNRKKWITPLIFSMLIISFLSWGYRLIVSERQILSNYSAFENMSKLPKGTTLLLNIPNGGEYEEEIRTQLHEFWGRRDINVGVLDLSKKLPDSYIVINSNQWSGRYLKQELMSKYKNISNVITADRYLVIATPDEVARCFVKTVAPFLIERKSSGFCNLYSYLQVQNSWEFYKN